MFSKLKSHLKWIVPAVAIILLVWFLASQSPKIISAAVSPEVIVKGKNQEVTVTAVVKPGLVVSPWFKVKAVLAGQSDMSEYNNFNKVITTLGNLTSQGKDKNGNVIYQNKFIITHNTAETLQVQLLSNSKKPLMQFAYQPKKVYFNPLLKTLPPNPDDPLFIPPLRLAVTTRPATLPPDPGEVGKQTLEGIDSDKDGLRDDIQREIFFAYPDSERARRALGDIYRTDIQWLENADNPEVLRALEHSRNKRAACLDDIKQEVGLPPSDRWPHIILFITDVEFNTKLRRDVVSKAGSNSMGFVIVTPEESKLGNCLFDPKSLPD